MDRRDFLSNSIKGLAGILLTSCAVDKIPYLNYTEFEKIEPKNNIINFKRIEEYQKIRLPIDLYPKKFTAQRIEENSQELVPFILKDKKEEYLFRKVKTSKNEFAEEILLYNPINSIIDERELTKKTIISEEPTLPKLNASKLKVDYSKEDILKRLPRELIIDIFNEKYLFRPVPYLYEEESDKTDFYLIPCKDLKMQRSKIFNNLLLSNSKGIFRGFSLKNAYQDIVEKEYRLNMY
jgi:hypothetical protein